MNVEVRGSWTACALATAPFSSSWDDIGDIIRWQEKALAQQEKIVQEQVRQPACAASSDRPTRSGQSTY